MLALLTSAACGGGAGAGGAGAGAAGGDGAPESGDQPVVVVSTSVLGDVVEHLVGDDVRLEVLMGPGADPHEFAPSAREAATIREADALVVNGAGFEEALLPTIAAARDDGVAVHEAISAVDTLTWDGHDDDDAHGHDEEEGSDDEDADGEGEVDPHFFTDPARMATAVEGIAEFLAAELDDVAPAAVRSRAESYVAEIEQVDREAERLLSEVPEERRILVTNHDVLGYFADRYGFEVLGSVLAAGTTLAESSPADLAALAEAVEESGVAAVFTDASGGDRLARALAAEVGSAVEVVALHTESLGPDGSGAETYLGMVRTNAELVRDALTG
jgi:zinc/manganese transport system substrate-binding protein